MSRLFRRLAVIALLALAVFGSAVPASATTIPERGTTGTCSTSPFGMPCHR